MQLKKCISIRPCFNLLYSQALLPVVPPFSTPDMTTRLALALQSFCPIYPARIKFLFHSFNNLDLRDFDMWKRDIGRIYHKFRFLHLRQNKRPRCSFVRRCKANRGMIFDVFLFEEEETRFLRAENPALIN